MKAKAGTMLNALRERAAAQLTKALQILYAKGDTHTYAYSDYHGQHEDQVVNAYQVYKLTEDNQLVYWNSKYGVFDPIDTCYDIYELATDADILLDRAYGM